MPENKATPPPPFFSEQVTSARRFYLNLKPSRTDDLAVVCGGWELCAADFQIDRSTFPYYAIEFVAAGAGDLELGGVRHTLSTGTVFSYGPGVSQRIRSSSTERLSKYFVNFTGRRARWMLGQAGISPGTVVTIGHVAEARQAFDLLISGARAHDRLASKAARLQFESLLIWIIRGARVRPNSARRAAATFERCRRHLDAHFRTLRTVEELAAACHLDVAYLTRLFRRFQDESPYKYLQRLQVQWAAERMQSTGCLVKTVASELNLDPFQFSRAFKRCYGISPSEFVNSH